MKTVLSSLGMTGTALVLVSLLGFAIYLVLLGRPVSLARTIAKTLSVAAMAGIAFYMGGPTLLVLALVLSSAGDAFLAHDGDVAFLGGLGSFLAAHVAYAVLFLSVGTELGNAPVAGLVAVVVFAAGMGFLMVRRAGPLALPVAIYVLAIACMGLGAVAAGGLVLAGAALFMLSDAILGSEKFLMPDDDPLRRLSSPAVWVLYYAGQALITLGLLA